MADRLTDKQERFVTEYLVDLNATAAARRAGYKDPNKGRQLVAKSNVSEAIQEAKAKRAARTEITQDRVLLELARIGFFDPRKLFDGEGNPKHIDELDADTAAAISQLDVDKTVDEDGTVTYTKKYRFADKLRALELTGKHLGMFSASNIQVSIDPDIRAKVEEMLDEMRGS